jgi:riboflavin kinase/FMN adenylyltransferase
MRQLHSYMKIPAELRGHVVAIGNFDGMHRGHQALLGRAKQIAAKDKKKLAVLTFEPHPRALFRPDDPVFRITSAPLKAQRLEDLGVDILFSIPFDWDFASQSAESFIKNVLIDGLGASHVVIGHDFRFGQLRKGAPEDIQKAGIPTTIIGEVKDEKGEELSSSRIRKALRDGDIATANALLGWEWEIQSEVVKGDQRGRKLGYPTANMNLGDTLHPAYGVYASRVMVAGEGKWQAAATNIGIRPMFEAPIALVETFIFDFDAEIYGQILRVRPVKRLRGEAKFDSLDALKDQMAKDCAEARKILK